MVVDLGCDAGSCDRFDFEFLVLFSAHFLVSGDVLVPTAPYGSIGLCSSYPN